jgi:hypothetical protein
MGGWLALLAAKALHERGEAVLIAFPTRLIAGAKREIFPIADRGPASRRKPGRLSIA